MIAIRTGESFVILDRDWRYVGHASLYAFGIETHNRRGDRKYSKIHPVRLNPHTSAGKALRAWKIHWT